jgi:hypothetical protein
MLASKVVPTSSGEFTIAPLTLRQVENLFSGERGPSRMEMVLTALRNTGTEPDADALKDQLSPRSIKELVDAIAELTGLDLAPTGESTAAETPGPSSTAA